MTLFEKVKEAIRLSDKVGRSRGSNCYALDKQAVDRLVVLEIGLEAEIKVALDAKDAEIAALKDQLTSLARGVKISIPTDTMEHEFHQHYKRGAASRDKEIAALRKAVQAVVDCDDNYRGRSEEVERMDYDNVVRQCREAIAQAVQP